jgi:hypothetical protein
MDAVNFHNATDVLATYAGQASDLKAWLSGAEINEDMSMRLQYLAGMGLNVDNPAAIYTQLLTYRRFPHALFTGSEQRVRHLEEQLSTTNR